MKRKWLGELTTPETFDGSHLLIIQNNDSAVSMTAKNAVRFRNKAVVNVNWASIYYKSKLYFHII